MALITSYFSTVNKIQITIHLNQNNLEKNMIISITLQEKIISNLLFLFNSLIHKQTNEQIFKLFSLLDNLNKEFMSNVNNSLLFPEEKIIFGISKLITSNTQYLNK